MNILLINNNTTTRDKLLAVLKDHEVNEQPFQMLGMIDISIYDCIILSGGSAYPLSENKEVYNDELNIIRESNKPIFGICLGFELIGAAFGEKLVRMEKMDVGSITSNVIQDDPILEGVEKTFQGYEHHHWVIQNMHTLIPLARSAHCIELCKHPTKFVYGSQFHPEKFLYTTQGKQILENFLELVASQQRL